MSIQDFALYGGAIAAFINAITTIPLVLVTWRTTVEAKKNYRGDFLLRLDEGFQQHRDVRAKLSTGGPWHKGASGPTFPEDEPAVTSYMGLFERIQVLTEEKLIDIDTVDRLYGSRFFNIVTNPIIYKERLIDHQSEWNDFIKLWKALEQSRLTTNRPLPEVRPSPDELILN